MTNNNRVERNLKLFDTMDFEGFSKQNWEIFDEIHSNDVEVIFPDGHMTTGLEKHRSDMQWMFTYAPDIRITDHPIKFGSGDWTCTTGVMEGTFTQSMITPDGETIPPTNMSFKIPMCTVIHWNEDGTMRREYLFWDNALLNKQMGIS